MTLSLFEFSEYKAYLKALFRSNPAYGHGFKSKLAKAIGCQTAYLSQVLNHDAQLSLEQAEDVNLMLKHSVQEAKFFLLLVQLARAANARLKTRLKSEVQEILDKRESLKERVEKTDALSLEYQSTYYSFWYYSALQNLITLPEYQSDLEKMAAALRLSRDVVSDALDFLVKTGLIKHEGGRYLPHVTRSFLDRDSPLISRLHTNWRLKAVESLEQNRKTDLHFSSCISLSRTDFRKIKDELIESINRARAVVKDSKEEELCCLGVDFFSLLR